MTFVLDFLFDLQGHHKRAGIFIDGITELTMEAQVSTFNNCICKIRGFSPMITKSLTNSLDKPTGQCPNETHMPFVQSRASAYSFVIKNHFISESQEVSHTLKALSISSSVPKNL